MRNWLIHSVNDAAGRAHVTHCTCRLDRFCQRLLTQDVFPSRHCRLGYWSVNMWWRDDADSVNRRRADHLVVIRKRVWNREFSRYRRRAIRVPSADGGDSCAFVRLEHTCGLLAEAGADDSDT